MLSSESGFLPWPKSNQFPSPFEYRAEVVTYTLSLSRVTLSKYLSPNIRSRNHNIQMFKPALKEYVLSHPYLVD